MPPDPLNGLRRTVELNLGLEKSRNFILSGKWQPCPNECNYTLTSETRGRDANR